MPGDATVRVRCHGGLAIILLLVSIAVPAVWGWTRETIALAFSAAIAASVLTSWLVARALDGAEARAGFESAAQAARSRTAASEASTMLRLVAERVDLIRRLARRRKRLATKVIAEPARTGAQVAPGEAGLEGARERLTEAFRNRWLH